MPCDLTTGRSHPCKDGVGGIKKVLVFNYVANAATVSNSQVTALNAAVTEVFEWELRADTNNNLDQAPESSKDNGTTIVNQTLNMRLQKQNAATHAEVMLMAKARPIFVVVDYNNNYHMAGLSEGMDLSPSNVSTGTAKGDFNGYDLIFTSTEVELAPMLDSATVTAIEALVSATKIAA